MGTRRGFSLVEMMVAMTITVAVFAITLPFLRAQTRSLGATAGRMDADQVARFAMRAVEQDLRRAAGDYGQPTIVAAGPMLLSFNANLRRADSLDVGALETEVIGAAAGAAWPVARAAPIPTTARAYPTTDYVNAAGDTSRTETVTYFLATDSASGPDMYVLYRQNNDQAPQALISGLFLPESQSFFRYFGVVNGYLQDLPADSVTFWTSPRMARIRTVGLRASGRYVNTFDRSVTVRTIETRVTLPVSLARRGVACASVPTGPTSGLGAAASGVPRGASLTWSRSAEDTGEPDGALYYIVERRPSGGMWSTIGLVNATGANAYALRDSWLRRSGSFEYGVRVIGCGDVSSSRASLGSLTL